MWALGGNCWRFLGIVLLWTWAASAIASAEHQAMLDLVPLNQVTHRAVASGDWSNPSTWQNNAVPNANARVHIPTSLMVRFDLNPSPPIQSIRVDGTLRWATAQSTELRVDTIVSTMSGSVVIGDQGEPISSGQSARIIFTDNGAINPVVDPTRVGRGLLTMGPVRIWGEARLPRFVQLAASAAIGNSQLNLASMPHGWRVGDTIVIAGTRYTGVLQTLPMATSDDEIRTISAINGNVLTLNQALQRTHAGPANRDWARAHVANLSCNVVFDSALGESTAISRRGHIMLMSQDVQVENACLYNLGRTDKRIPINDPVVNLDGTPGDGSNPRGRYSLHLHKTGTDHLSNWMQKPATIRGCVVRNSPGWGIAVHQSHAVVEDCASYNVFGAHFVTEDGNEQGAFRRNIALWARGDINNRGYKDGTGNHDLAHSGCGFWIQGRDFGVEGNVASGMGDAGFCWFHRSQIWSASTPMRVFVDNVSRPLRPLLHLRTPITVGSTLYGEFNYNDVPIAQVRDNLTYASGTAFRVTKASPLQFGDQFSFLSGLHSFNTEEGLFHEYTQHYAYDGIDLIGMDAQNSFRNGITSWSQADHLVFRNGRIANFGNCLRTGLFFNAPAGLQNDHPNVLLLDTELSNCATPWQNFSPVNPRGSRQVALTAAALGNVPLSFAPAPGQSFTLPFATTDFVLNGTLTDGSGSWPIRVEWGGGGPLLLEHLNTRGYHTRVDGSRVIRLQTQFHGRADPQQTLNYVFELGIPTPAGIPLGPNNGPLPSYVPNAAPVAVDQHYQLTMSGDFRLDVPVAQGLLNGASDIDGGALQVLLMDVEPPRYGAISVAPNGALMYRRDVRTHALPEQIRYRLHDTWQPSNWAQITIEMVAADLLFADDFEQR